MIVCDLCVCVCVCVFLSVQAVCCGQWGAWYAGSAPLRGVPVESEEEGSGTVVEGVSPVRNAAAITAGDRGTSLFLWPFGEGVVDVCSLF